MCVAIIPTQVENVNLKLLASNAAAIKVEVRYATAPNNSTYKNTEKINDKNTPARNEDTRREILNIKKNFLKNRLPPAKAGGLIR